MVGMAAVKQARLRKVAKLSVAEKVAYNLGRSHMRMEMLDFLHAEYMSTEGTAPENPIADYQLKLIRRLVNHLKEVSPDRALDRDDLPELPPEREAEYDRETMVPRPGR